MMRGYVSFIVRYARSVVVLLILATLFFASRIPGLLSNMMFDPKSILPQDHPYVRDNNRIEETFGGSRVVVLGIVKKNGDLFNPESLAKIAAITEEVKKIPGIKEENVVSIADRKIKDVRATSVGIEVTRLMEETPRTKEAAAHLKSRVFANDLYVGSLISRDGKAAAVITDYAQGLPPPGFEGGGAAPSPSPDQIDPCDPWGRTAYRGWLPDATIHCRLKMIQARYEDSEHSIYLGGMPIVLSFFEADAWRMLMILFPLSIVLIGGIHYLAFRSWQGLVVPLLTAILSVVWTMGLMGVLGAPLDPWNAMTPILILAIAAGHSVQILKRYYEEYDRLESVADPRQRVRQAVIESTSKAGKATLAAVLTTAAAFGSLIVFPLKTFQVFGIFTALGTLSAFALEMTFIPALRSLLRPARRRRPREEKLDRWMAFLGRAVTAHRLKVLAAGGLLTLISMIGTYRLYLLGPNNSNRSLFFSWSELRRDEAELNRRFAGTSTIYLLIEGKDDRALKDPAVIEALDRLERRLETFSEVGKAESYVDYLKKMNLNLHGGDPAFDRVPDRPDLAAQYLFLYSVSGNPTDMARLIDASGKAAVVWIFLKSDSTVLAQRLISEVERYRGATPALAGLKMSVAGSSPVVVALNEEMVKGKILNIIWVMVITFLICAAVRRSWLGGGFVMVPLFLAVLVNFAVMGFTGITLSIGTAAISAMAVGMGADYEIYMIFRMREEFQKRGDPQEAVAAAISTSGKAIVYITTAVSTGYALLAFTGYYLHMEGILVPLAMLTSSLGALTILPALALTFRPKFIFAR